jgi:lysophospholipid acyltransferase (LPLAT)-like uncharacterized protein
MRFIALQFGPLLAAGLIRTLRTLMRWRSVNEEVVLVLNRAGKPYVHAFFHDQLLMMTYSYLGRPHGRRLAVLSSRQRARRRSVPPSCAAAYGHLVL